MLSDEDVAAHVAAMARLHRKTGGGLCPVCSARVTDETPGGELASVEGLRIAELEVEVATLQRRLYGRGVDPSLWSGESIMFSVPGAAEGLPRHRTVMRHGRTYQVADRKGEAYKGRVRAHYAAATGFRTRVRGGPVRLLVDAAFAVPASWPKRRRAAALAGETLPTKVPDADNIAKAVCDALNKYAWRDDRQVVQLGVCKRFGERAELGVEIEFLSPREAG